MTETTLLERGFTLPFADKSAQFLSGFLVICGGSLSSSKTA
jgi:hypothetical protein